MNGTCGSVLAPILQDMDVWTDGLFLFSFFFARWRFVLSALSCPLSLFSQKEEMARQKLKRKRLSQPWEGVGLGGERQQQNRQKAWRVDWLFGSRACHASASFYERSHPPLWSLSRRGRQNSASPQTEMTLMIFRSCFTARFLGDSQTSLAHKEGFTYVGIKDMWLWHLVWICCKIYECMTITRLVFSILYRLCPEMKF